MFQRSEMAKPLTDNIGAGRLASQQEARQYVTGKETYKNVIRDMMQGMKVDNLTVLQVGDTLPYDAQLQQAIVDLKASPPAGFPTIFGTSYCLGSIDNPDNAKKISLFVRKKSGDYAMSLWKESKFNLPGMPSPQGASASSIESTPTPSYNVKDFAKLVPHGETVLIMTEEVKEALKTAEKRR